MKEAFYQIIAGSGIILSSDDKDGPLISVSWNDGEEDNDSANIVLDNRNGQVAPPSEKSYVIIIMGWSRSTASEVFIGRTKKAKLSGGSGGRTITIACEAGDSQGKTKERQQATYKDKNVKYMMEDMARRAGKKPPMVDPDLGKIRRELEIVDGESYTAFSKRLAREIGGRFKMVGDVGLLVKEDGSTTTSGKEMPPFVIADGDNLHSWTGFEVGEPKVDHFEHVTRYFDFEKGDYVEEKTEGRGNSEAVARTPVISASKDDAKGRADAEKKKSDKESGAGSITCEGDNGLFAGRPIDLRGTEDGSDGIWRAKSVSQNYTVGAGWVATVPVDHPKGEAGASKKKSKPAPSKPAGKSYAEQWYS